MKPCKFGLNCHQLKQGLCTFGHDKQAGGNN